MRVTTRLVYNHLIRNGMSAVLSNGHLSTKDRIKNLSIFTTQENIMVTTNILARGVNLSDVGVVINYDLPVGKMGNINETVYIHRAGRTGRMGK